MRAKKYHLFFLSILMGIILSSCYFEFDPIDDIMKERCEEKGGTWDTANYDEDPLDEPVCMDENFFGIDISDPSEPSSVEGDQEDTQEEIEETDNENRDSLLDCNAADEFSLIISEKSLSESGDTITCKYFSQTVNLTEVGVVLSYYYVYDDNGEISTNWQQWFYDPSEELDWPLISVFYPDKKSLRYWSEYAVRYSRKECDWIDWEDTNYEKIAISISDFPCLVP